MIVWSLFSHQSLKKSTALGLYECQPAKLKAIRRMEHTNIDFDYDVVGIKFVKCMSTG